MKPTILFISCEHAVNIIPSSHLHLFQEQMTILNSSQAFDIHAQTISKYISQKLACDYVEAPVSRLLIDCNRSISHSHCFSTFTKSLTRLEKQELIEHYYQPFRQQAQNLIQAHINQNKQVLHLSIHTFTPTTNGQVRNAGIGILYDSHRHGEKEVSRLWHGLLSQQTPAYRIRMNYPFSGNFDAFINQLRKQYTERDYLGLIVECNQALLTDKTSLTELSDVLTNSLDELLQLL